MGSTTGPGKPGPGRPKGRRNNITLEIRALAQPYGPEALETLVGMMRNGKTPAPSRVAACREIMDRAYGKAVQAVSVDPDSGALVVKVIKLADGDGA